MVIDSFPSASIYESLTNLQTELKSKNKPNKHEVDMMNRFISEAQNDKVCEINFFLCFNWQIAWFNNYIPICKCLVKTFT